MRESGYYPQGAEFSREAPWNERKVPERNFKVLVSQCLSKSTEVTTDDYHPEMVYRSEGVVDELDTSDTNWHEAYNQCHYTPLQLINYLSCLLHKQLTENFRLSPKEISEYKDMIGECEGWTEDNIEIIEDD